MSKEGNPRLESYVHGRYQAAVINAKEQLGKSTIKNWLDIGENSGIGVGDLTGYCGDTKVIDVNFNYVQETAINHPSVSGIVMNGCLLGFHDNSFQVVSAMEMIEHIGGEDQKKLLKEVNRVLKPGGVFIISTPNKEYSKNIPVSPDHIKELFPEELRNLLTENGFNVIRELGQLFFKENLKDQLIQFARQNQTLVSLYHRFVSPNLRKQSNNFIFDSVWTNEVRMSEANEKPMIMFLVCQKLT